MFPLGVQNPKNHNSVANHLIEDLVGKSVEEHAPELTEVETRPPGIPHQLPPTTTPFHRGTRRRGQRAFARTIATRVAYPVQPSAERPTASSRRLTQTSLDLGPGSTRLRIRLIVALGFLQQGLFSVRGSSGLFQTPELSENFPAIRRGQLGQFRQDFRFAHDARLRSSAVDSSGSSDSRSHRYNFIYSVKLRGRTVSFSKKRFCLSDLPVGTSLLSPRALRVSM